MPISGETIDGNDIDGGSGPGMALRLKQWLIAPVRLLQRLRRAETAEPAEEAQARARRRGRPGAQEDAEVDAETTAPLWHRLMPYGAVLLAGLAAGSGLIYALNAKVLARQAVELDAQKTEITRLRELLAGYDKLVLKNDKTLADERGRRAAAENRLATAQADLARRPQENTDIHADRPGDGTTMPGHSVAAGRDGRCTLQSANLGQTLKACLDGFNAP